MRSRCLLLSIILVVGACDKKAETILEPPPIPTKDARLRPGIGETAPGAKTGNDSLKADDAPYVHGKIVFVGPWKEENLAVGFVGMGSDGKPHSNMAGTTLASERSGFATSLTFQPQLTGLTADDQGSLTFRHTRVPAGEYLVYVQRNKVLAAWQKVTLK